MYWQKVNTKWFYFKMSTLILEEACTHLPTSPYQHSFWLFPLDKYLVDWGSFNNWQSYFFYTCNGKIPCEMSVGMKSQKRTKSCQRRFWRAHKHIYEPWRLCKDLLVKLPDDSIKEFQSLVYGIFIASIFFVTA